MVSEGLGIAIMKIPAIPSERRGLAYCRLRDSSLIEETGIAYRRDNRSAKVRGFIGLVRGRVGDLAGDLQFQDGFTSKEKPDSRQLTLF